MRDTTNDMHGIVDLDAALATALFRVAQGVGKAFAAALEVRAHVRVAKDPESEFHGWRLSFQ